MTEPGSDNAGKQVACWGKDIDIHQSLRIELLQTMSHVPW